MLNQGNILPGGGKDIKRFQADRDPHSGSPTTAEQSLENFSVKGSSPDNVNVRPISDGQGPRPNPKRTMLPESDDALAQYAAIQASKLSQGVFTHEQNVDIPSEGFNDPANRKV